MDQLCSDIIFKILNYLTIQETEQLIDTLHSLLEVDDINQLKFKQIITFCYQRIYQSKFTIYSNQDCGNASRFDKCLPIEDFGNKFNVPLSNDLESLTFNNTRPQYIEFIFVRQPTDYIKFVKDLYQFSQMFDTESETLIQYFDSIYQYGVYINGKSLLVEPTTSFLVSILKVLISISNNDPKSHLFCNKIKRLTIKSTDIGQYYIKQWCTLFSRFNNIEFLDLSDNLIKSDNSINDDIYDILGNYFQWPPVLKILRLESNFISYVSRQFIKNLPKTLQSLYLDNNWLTSLGIESNEQFTLTDLPNLVTLSLSNNNRLMRINAEIFSGGTNFKHLYIKGCNLTDEAVMKLTELAGSNQFVIGI